MSASTLRMPASTVPIVEIEEDDIGKFEKQIDEAEKLVEQHRPKAIRKELLAVDDILARASVGLDSLQLVGAKRDCRRVLLRRIEALGAHVEKRRAALTKVLEKVLEDGSPSRPTVGDPSRPIVGDMVTVDLLRELHAAKMASQRAEAEAVTLREMLRVAEAKAAAFLAKAALFREEAALKVGTASQREKSLGEEVARLREALSNSQGAQAQANQFGGELSEALQRATTAETSLQQLQTSAAALGEELEAVKARSAALEERAGAAERQAAMTKELQTSAAALGEELEAVKAWSAALEERAGAAERQAAMTKELQGFHHGNLQFVVQFANAPQIQIDSNLIAQHERELVEATCTILDDDDDDL